jgi:O-antigen/teichoic acid export membrane protein
MTASTSPGGQDKTPTNAALPEGEGGLPARFGRNVFMNYFAQGLTALSAAVLTPILLHHLGKSTYGLWVVASGAVTYLELFELGFGGATTKLISEDADVRPELALRTLNTNFFVLVPLGLIALAVGVGLSFAMPHLVHVSPDQRVGHQRYDLLAASNATMTVATTVAGILVVLAGGGVVLLALVTSAISILTHLLRLSMVRAIMPGTRISPRLIDRGQRRHALRVSGWFLLGAVLSAIYATGDVMIVGIVLGLRDAAIYAVGSKLAAATINGLDAMAQVFFPHASSAARNREPGALGEITIDGTRVTFGAGLMVSLALIVLAGPGVRAWVGPGFGTSAQVLLVLAIATALASPVRAMGNILIGAGKYPLAAAIRGGEVTVNIALSVTLGLVMGPVGVAVGTLGGILLVRLPTQLVAGCRATGVHTWTFVQRALLPNVVPAIGCTASLFVLRLVPLQSLAWVVLEAILACMVYLVLFFLTATSPAERRRTMAFVTRPLPARWRSAVEVSSPAATVDEAP